MNNLTRQTNGLGLNCIRISRRLRLIALNHHVRHLQFYIWWFNGLSSVFCWCKCSPSCLNRIYEESSIFMYTADLFWWFVGLFFDRGKQIVQGVFGLVHNYSPQVFLKHLLDMITLCIIAYIIYNYRLFLVICHVSYEVKFSSVKTSNFPKL